MLKKLKWAITIMVLGAFLVPALGNVALAASYPQSYITIDANKHTMDNRAEATGVLKGQVDGYYVNGHFFISGNSSKEVTKNGQQFTIANTRGTSEDDIYSVLTVTIVEKKTETPTVKPTEPSKPATVKAEKVIYKVKVTANTVTIRDKNSSKGKKLGTAKKKATLEVTKTSGSWTRVKYGKTYGWVESKNVQRIYPVIYKGHVTATELTVRNSNSTKGKKLGTIEKNTAVNVVENKSGWYKIEYKDGYAWVSNKYVKKVKYSAKVTASALNVRKSNSTKAKSLGTLKKNAKVDVVGTKGSWSEIKYKSGYGWVSSKYIKKS